MKKHQNIAIPLRNYSEIRKRLIRLIEKADDRQLLRLYAFAHRMIDDTVK